MPRVLRPGSWAAKTGVTALAVGLLVLPGLLRPWNTKSVTFTWAAVLHTRPLRVMVEVASATQKTWMGSASEAKASMGRIEACKRSVRKTMGLSVSILSNRWLHTLLNSLHSGFSTKGI
jgi:hypothetical protein